MDFLLRCPASFYNQPWKNSNIEVPESEAIRVEADQLEIEVQPYVDR